jgi:hypothetical protein
MCPDIGELDSKCIGCPLVNGMQKSHGRVYHCHHEESRPLACTPKSTLYLQTIKKRISKKYIPDSSKIEKFEIHNSKGFL